MSSFGSPGLIAGAPGGNSRSTRASWSWTRRKPPSARTVAQHILDARRIVVEAALLVAPGARQYAGSVQARHQLPKPFGVTLVVRQPFGKSFHQGAHGLVGPAGGSVVGREQIVARDEGGRVRRAVELADLEALALGLGGPYGGQRVQGAPGAVLRQIG